MNFFHTHKLSVLAFALIIVSNVVILYGVFANKTGEPTSTATLTERELILPYQNISENSAISLRINFRTANNNDHKRGNARWLTTKKLNTLGFDVAKGIESDYRRSVQKEVFIVLENDGKTYQDALADAKDKVAKLQEEGAREQTLKRAINELQAEQFQQSRLFAIDADIDATVLRAKYQDKAKYIIARGVITVRYTKNEVHASVSDLSIKNIYVPPEYSGFLQTLQPIRNAYNDEVHKPRYSVTIKYGKRFEPYITSLKQMKTD